MHNANIYNKYIHACMHAHTHTTILRLSGFCPGQPRRASTRRNIHPLTHIVVISHPLSASTIYYNPRYPPCSIYVPDSHFPQSLQVFFGLPPGLVPSTSYSIHSFTNHCLLFVTHAHTIATCFAVVPRLCHLILVSLSTLYLELDLVASCHTHPSNHSHLCLLKCHLIFLSYGPYLNAIK